MKITPAKSRTAHSQYRSGFQGIATCFAIALFAGRVLACDFCLRLPRVPFEFDHPAAIEVAMATQAAAEQGQLDLNPSITMERTREMPLAEVSAQHLVAQWIRSRPAQSYPSLRCTLELVFVDVDETCWLDIRSGEVLPGDPRSGPADIRLMTTKAGFCQLREIGLAKCEQLQWAAVDCTRAANRIAIDRLFPIPTTQETSDIWIRYDHAWTMTTTGQNGKIHRSDLNLGRVVQPTAHTIIPTSRTRVLC